MKIGITELTIRGRRVVTPEGVRPAAIVVRGGVIAEIRPFEAGGRAAVDAGGLAVMPGLVDTHVHVNEPGRTEWEGFETATAAAAAGGITTLVDMPLNSIPVTTTAEALRRKIARARDRVRVDCGFWGGVVPGNADELEDLIAAGALGFKAFLIDSGIADFPPVAEADLREAMEVLAARGAPLLVHAEVCRAAATTQPPPTETFTPLRGVKVPKPSPTGRASVPSEGAKPLQSYADYLGSRPKDWENEAVAMMVRLCRQTSCRVHIVHLSSAGALGALAEARRERLPLTAETCPHYLFFAAEEVPEGATEFKCAPPIREAANRERLWRALKDGLIDFIVSDHSPCVPGLKARDTGDFLAAWGGIASLQLTLSAVWTEARRRGHGLEDIMRWMSERPARFAGLKRKGRIAPGFDADLVLWSPEASFTPAPSMIRHRHKLTPYAGRRLDGVVEATFLRGIKIFGKGAARTPIGRLLLNSDQRIATA